MDDKPIMSYLSLFVPALAEAAQRYEKMLGIAPTQDDRTPPHPHPFAGSAPVVFDLGGVKLALYQANPDRGTHPGDVGIGLRAPAAMVAARAAQHGGKVLYGPKRVPGDGREMAVFVLPDRHFFELVAS